MGPHHFSKLSLLKIMGLSEALPIGILVHYPEEVMSCLFFHCVHDQPSKPHSSPERLRCAHWPAGAYGLQSCSETLLSNRLAQVCWVSEHTQVLYLQCGRAGCQGGVGRSAQQEEGWVTGPENEGAVSSQGGSDRAAAAVCV